jgi:4-hydroxy-tetrahydrodipicolinate reductase
MFGVGRVGRDVTRLLSARPGFRLVSAYTRNAGLAGKDLGECAGTERLGVAITTDRTAALRPAADIVVIATTSFLRDLAEDIRAAVTTDRNAIVTGEEMLYPWIVDRPLAEELNRLAVKHGVTILGAGANPGFIFDALVLTASGATWNVESIRGRRVVNCSHFSATILRRLGFGYTREEFESGVQAEKVYGHIGFPQSIHLVAARLGLEVERIEKSMQPLIAERPYSMEHLQVCRVRRLDSSRK